MAYDEKPWRSVSQLRTLSDCGEAYRILKVSKLPSKPAAWTVRGIAVHDTIEQWERSSRSLDPVKYITEEAWPKAFEKMQTQYPDLDNWLRTPGVKNTANDLKLREKESPDHVSVYCDRAVREESRWRVWQPGSSNPPAVEVEFRLDFGDFKVVGYIDQIIEWYSGESYTIKDIKSGRDSKEDNRQLGLYAYAANQLFNLGITSGSYWYTKLDKDTGLKDLSPYTKEYLHDQYSVLNSMIEAKHFLANPEREKCQKFCGMRDHCREWPKI